LDHIEDPRQRLIEYTRGAIELVRGEPALAAWFEPDESGATARMGRGAEEERLVVQRFVVASVLGKELLNTQWGVGETG
jgi:hypothetical protein